MWSRLAARRISMVSECDFDATRRGYSSSKLCTEMEGRRANSRRTAACHGLTPGMSEWKSP